MPVIQHHAPVPATPRQAHQQFPPAVKSKFPLIHFHFELLAYQSRRHRVAHLLHPNRAGPADRASHLVIFAQPGRRQRLHHGQLRSQLLPPPVIAALQHLLQKLSIGRFRFEIPAAAQQQTLPHPPLQMPVARFHVAVLVGTVDANGPRDQPKMLAQRKELLVELPTGSPAADPMRGRTAVVHPQLPRNLAQPMQRFLQPLLARQQRLGQTGRGPFPVGMRQHAMTEQMVVSLAAERDRQFGSVGPIHLQSPPRLPVLWKKYFPIRPIAQSPLLDPALKSPQMLFLRRPGRTLPQILEKRFGFQIRRFRQHRFGLRPDLAQRILPRAPSVFDLQFLGRLSCCNILAGRRAAHVRLQGAVRYVSSLLIVVHQFSVLLFGDHCQQRRPSPLALGEAAA